MAKRDDTLSTEKSADEALAAGKQTMESLGMKVNQTGPGALEAKGGSLFLTYWIGLFLPDSSMPVKVSYSVTDQGSSRTIQIHTKSSVPLALYTWKFKNRADAVAKAVTQGVGARLGQAAPQPVG